MDTKKFLYLSCSYLIIVITACSPLGPTLTTEAPVSTPTNEVVLEPTSTKAIPAIPTVIPTPSIKQEWTIKVGDLKHLGVGSDGTIYGIGNNLYAIISKDGEVLQTNEVDFGECFYGKIEGGAGNMEIDARWYVIKPDGTFVTKPLRGAPCIITPGNPPILTRPENSDYFPYADQIPSKKASPAPNGFENAYFEGWLFSNTSTPYFFINKQDRKASFVDHNGDLRYFDLPEDFDLDNHDDEIRVVITPWDHVYYSYAAYDALGNELGDKRVMVDENGNSKSITTFPSLNYSRDNDIRSMVTYPLYIPGKKEVYIKQGNSIALYDLNFNELARYPLPLDFPEITYNLLASTNKLFLGHDGAFYVFDIETRNLTKYSLSSSTSGAQVVPMTQSALDQEAVAFRDQALKVIQGLETVEYLIKFSSSEPETTFDTGVGRSTLNAIHETYFYKDGSMALDYINVDATACNRTSLSEPPECETGNSLSTIQIIINVLNEETPFPLFEEPISMMTGSFMDTYEGGECRSFFVQRHFNSDAINSVDIEVSEVCLDLQNYFPLRLVHKTARSENGEVTYWRHQEIFNMKSNVQIEEIVLPPH